MSKKDKVQKITFKSILRLVIFLVLVWFIISILSQQKTNGYIIDDPTLSLDEIDESLGGDVLGEMYFRIPEDSRNQAENFFNNTSQFIQEKLNGFPQKQIKEIKKAIIKNISDEMIKNIDEN